MKKVVESVLLYVSAGLGFMQSVVEAIKFNIFNTHG